MGSPTHQHHTGTAPEAARPRASSMSFLQPSSGSSSTSSLTGSTGSVSSSPASSDSQLMRQRASSMSLLSTSVRKAAANAAASRRYSSGGHGEKNPAAAAAAAENDQMSSYYQRMRERNNEASKRCRLKRRMKAETMEYQAQMLGKHNRWLKDRLNKMEGVKKALVALKQEMKPMNPDCQCTQALAAIASKANADYPEDCNLSSKDLISSSQSCRELSAADHPGFSQSGFGAGGHPLSALGSFSEDLSEPNSPIRSRSNSNTQLPMAAAGLAALGNKGMAGPLVQQVGAQPAELSPGAAASACPVIQTDVNQRIKTALNFVGRRDLSVTPIMKPPPPFQHKQITTGPLVHQSPVGQPPVILMPAVTTDPTPQATAAAAQQMQQQQSAAPRKTVTALDVLNETIVKSLKPPVTTAAIHQLHHQQPETVTVTAEPQQMPQQQMTPINLIKIDSCGQLTQPAAVPKQLVLLAAAPPPPPPPPQQAEWTAVRTGPTGPSQLILQRTPPPPLAPMQESIVVSEAALKPIQSVSIVKSGPLVEEAAAGGRNSACVASFKADGGGGGADKGCSGDLISLNKLNGYIDLATRAQGEREDGGSATEKSIIKSRLKMPFWVADEQSPIYICTEHRRSIVMDRVMTCTICGKDRSAVPRGLKTKPHSVMMTITYGMSLQYQTTRGSILPIGSLICGLCRESHLKGIDLTHSKLMTRKEEGPGEVGGDVTAAAPPPPSVVVTVMPPHNQPHQVTHPAPAAELATVATPGVKPSKNPSSKAPPSKQTDKKTDDPKSAETIFTKISKLNEALNAINPRYKPIGFSITSIESCSPSVLQDATLATETAISTLMSVIAPGNEAFLWRAIKPRLDEKLLSANEVPSPAACNEDVEMTIVKHEADGE